MMTAEKLAKRTNASAGVPSVVTLAFVLAVTAAVAKA